MITDKTRVVLLKRGGRIWISENDAKAISEAMLAQEEMVDIGGQVIRVEEIRAVVGGDTYQTTQEARIERVKTSAETNLPPTKSMCGICRGYRFVEDKFDRIENGINYGHAVHPCPQCNPNPPELKY